MGVWVKSEAPMGWSPCRVQEVAEKSKLCCYIPGDMEKDVQVPCHA